MPENPREDKTYFRLDEYKNYQSFIPKDFQLFFTHGQINGLVRSVQ